MVPLKELNTTKTRLDCDSDLRELVTAKMWSLVGQVLASRSEIESLHLISPQDYRGLLPESTRWGWIDETHLYAPTQSPNLNRSLQLAVQAVASDSALTGPSPAAGLDTAAEKESGYLGILFPDLPFLSPSDLEALFIHHQHSRSQVVVIGDASGRGTNGLVVQRELAFSFQFGPDSQSLHLSQCWARGYSVSLFRSPGLMADLDYWPQTPDQQAKLNLALGLARGPKSESERAPARPNRMQAHDQGAK